MNSIRYLIVFFTLIFVNVALATPPEAAAPQVEAGKSSHKIIAYYFHGNSRCKTCKAMEAYTREAIETAFPEQLKNGRLELQLVNVDLDENEHFVEDFKLSTRSVVIADFTDGKQTRFKTLDRTWQLVKDKAAFLAYIQAEITPWLSEGK